MKCSDPACPCVEHDSGDECTVCLRLMKELNDVTGRKYRGSSRTKGMLHGRHKTYGYEAVSKTIAHRWTRVIGTQFEWTMRPETLFNATKFDGYQAMAQIARQEAKKDDEGWVSRRSK